MEYPEPYHSAPKEEWEDLEKDRERNPYRIPKPFDTLKVTRASGFQPKSFSMVFPTTRLAGGVCTS